MAGKRQYNKKRHKSGFVVFLAVLVVSIALAIGITLASITVKSLELSRASRESVYAVYAADTGAECALMWDVRGLELKGYTIFSTSTDSIVPMAGSGISCLGTEISTVWVPVQGPTSATTTFEISLPGSRCTYVQVVKNAITASDIRTEITARGYNTSCSFTPQTVERAYKISY